MAPGTRLPSNPARCTFLHDCSRMSPGLICTRSILKHAPFTDGVRRRSKPKLIVCQSLPQQVLSRCAASAAALACSALLSVYGKWFTLMPDAITAAIDVDGLSSPNTWDVQEHRHGLKVSTSQSCSPTATHQSLMWLDF